MLTPYAQKPNLKKATDPSTPELAIVLYGGGGSDSGKESQYATIHKVKNNLIQAGRLIDLASVRRTISKRANKSNRSAQVIDVNSIILPDNVLVSTPELMIWHTPKQKREMWFSRKQKVPVRVWWPSLIFAMKPGRSSSLVIWAKSSNQRPTVTTRLYHSPLMNIDSKGVLCQGGAKLPTKHCFDNLEKMENTLFDSYFTHLNGEGMRGNKSIYNKDGAHIAFWVDKERRNATVKSKEMQYASTYGEWLTKIAVGANQ